ncbi:MAG: class I SAM-dependent methyltransferase, partial [Pseudolabrys sp.]
IQPLLFGQVHTNKRAIGAHYDIDPTFFLSFLDPETPCYTQGVYEDPSETLSTATLRKFKYCFEKLELKGGDHLLEIGPGWGAWFEYASKRGVRCTGISNSQTSVEYLSGRANQLGFDWEMIKGDFLQYQTDRKYDAIVIMGVIEHLPNYGRVLSKFTELVKPGRRIFLDASACTQKYELSSFMVKHIYGGNHSFLVLHDLLDKMSRTPLLVQEMFDDRLSYFLTFQQWARNFDHHRDTLSWRNLASSIIAVSDFTFGVPPTNFSAEAWIATGWLSLIRRGKYRTVADPMDTFEFRNVSCGAG